MKVEFVSDQPVGVSTMEDLSENFKNVYHCARGLIDLGEQLVEIFILFDRDYFPKIASAFFGREIKEVEADLDLAAELLNNLLGMVRGDLEKKSLSPAARFRPIIPTPFIGSPAQHLTSGAEPKLVWSVSSPDAIEKIQLLVSVLQKESTA
jgi:hypothetical protein